MTKTKNGQAILQTTLPKDTVDKMQLPILSINSMSEGQLRDFIPDLLDMVKSKMDDKTVKPDWWPNDLPWSDTQTHVKYQQASWVDTLRDVVRCCYKHLGQEKLLQESPKDKIKTCFNSTLPTSVSPSFLACLQQNTVLTDTKVKKETQRRYSEIFVCFFCEREFANKSEMRAHQIICEERPPDLHAISSPPRELSPKEGNLPPQMSPVKIPPVETIIRLTQDRYIRNLNLVQKQKAAKIIARHRCSSMDIDCNLDFDEPETPLSPPTPRTPKSLISQLSREDSFSSSRKRLSYSHDDGVNDQESVASGGSNDEERPSHVNKSLLTIDVSSLLGQRIAKYMKNETNLVIIKDSESFCRTPDKKEYFEKLRNRSNQYPIFYRPRKCFDLLYSHLYKFNKKQKLPLSRVPKIKPMMIKKLAECTLPKCRVVINKLTKSDLRRWLPKSDVKKVTEEIFLDENNNLFPKVPILHSKECDKLLGLKKRSLKSLNKANHLSLTNFISEDDNAEVSKQKLTVYKCLLAELDDISTKTLKIKVEDKLTPKWSSSKYKQFRGKDNEDETPLLKCETALAQAVVERRLSNILSERMSDKVLPTTTIEEFSVRRNDDNISILSLSTSDDESYVSGCCAECKRKKQCMCSPQAVSPSVPLSKQVTVKIDNIAICDGKSGCDTQDKISSPFLSPTSTLQQRQCNCKCPLSSNNGDIFASIPSPPPSEQKQSPRSLCSDSDGHCTDLENSLANSRTSPYKLRVSSPKKSFPDFEMYLKKKIHTTALGERINNHCEQVGDKVIMKPAKMQSLLSGKPYLVSPSSEPNLSSLRRSKRIRSPSASCGSSPAKLRKLESR